MVTWTAPRTWVTGETVTAVIMNQAVRDNLLAIVPATWQLTHVADFVPGSGLQDITWTTEDIDTDAFHTGSDAFITIPSGLGGTYWVSVQMHFFTADLSVNDIRIRAIKNATDVFSFRDSADGRTNEQKTVTVTGSFYIALAATDTLKLEIQVATDWTLEWDTASESVTGSWFNGTRLPTA